MKHSRYPLSQPGGTVERWDGLGERQDNCPALQMNYVLETHIVEPESQSLGVNGQGHCCLPAYPAHVLTQGHYAAQDPSSGCHGVDGGHRSTRPLQIVPHWSWAPPCPTSQWPMWGEVEESSWVSQHDLPNRMWPVVAPVFDQGSICLWNVLSTFVITSEAWSALAVHPPKGELIYCVILTHWPQRWRHLGIMWPLLKFFFIHDIAAWD